MEENKRWVVERERWVEDRARLMEDNERWGVEREKWVEDRARLIKEKESWAQLMVDTSTFLATLEELPPSSREERDGLRDRINQTLRDDAENSEKNFWVNTRETSWEHSTINVNQGTAHFKRNIPKNKVRRMTPPKLQQKQDTYKHLTKRESNEKLKLIIPVGSHLSNGSKSAPMKPNSSVDTGEYYISSGDSDSENNHPIQPEKQKVSNNASNDYHNLSDDESQSSFQVFKRSQKPNDYHSLSDDENQNLFDPDFMGRNTERLNNKSLVRKSSQGSQESNPYCRLSISSEKPEIPGALKHDSLEPSSAIILTCEATHSGFLWEKMGFLKSNKEHWALIYKGDMFLFPEPQAKEASNKILLAGSQLVHCRKGFSIHVDKLNKVAKYEFSAKTRDENEKWIQTIQGVLPKTPKTAPATCQWYMAAEEGTSEEPLRVVPSSPPSIQETKRLAPSPGTSKDQTFLPTMSQIKQGRETLNSTKARTLMLQDIEKCENSIEDLEEANSPKVTISFSHSKATFEPQVSRAAPALPGLILAPRTERTRSPSTPAQHVNTSPPTKADKSGVKRLPAQRAKPVPALPGQQREEPLESAGSPPPRRSKVPPKPSAVRGAPARGDRSQLPQKTISTRSKAYSEP